jgi:hypothetical protein
VLGLETWLHIDILRLTLLQVIKSLKYCINVGLSQVSSVLDTLAAVGCQQVGGCGWDLDTLAAAVGRLRVGAR